MSAAETAIRHLATRIQDVAHAAGRSEFKRVSEEVEAILCPPPVDTEPSPNGATQTPVDPDPVVTEGGSSEADPSATGTEDKTVN